MIRSLNQEDIHSLCSAQVISTLSSSVKELLENSIDAKASSIDVSIKDCGLTSISVADNGRGINEDDFSNITASHATSKIAQFTDLERVESFGFRGEALSALCVLSDLVIATRHCSSDIGHRLVFNKEGSICERSKIPISVGTVVTVKNIFSRFPVRCKDLRKNIKKEYAKLINTLQSFAIGFPHVKFSCTNENEGKSKQNVLNTIGGPSANLKLSIVSIFGPKQWDALIEWRTYSIPEEELTSFGVSNVKQAEQVFEMVEISGFVSSVAHGSGRSTPDRQLFYLNRRPCEQPKIAKVLNEVYHQFNSTQYPFFCLFLNIALGNFDVNVTPDKRSIFVKHEKVLLAFVKYSALQLFKIHAGNFTTNQSLTQKSLGTFNSQPVADKSKVSSSQNSLETFLSFFSQPKKSQASKMESSQSVKKLVDAELGQFSFVPNNHKSGPKRNSNDVQGFLSQNSQPKSKILKHNIEFPFDLQSPSESRSCDLETPLTRTGLDLDNVDDFECDLIIDKQMDERIHLSHLDVTSEVTDKVPFHVLIQPIQFFGFETIENFYDAHQKRDGVSQETDGRKFLARLDDKDAETELRSVLSKESFSQMSVIGQFNQGFIIAKLRSDLFIVDQHASDEKYNFELLEAHHEVPVQPLISPILMELTHEHYCLLSENFDVFRRNGFTFDLGDTDGSTVGSSTRVVKVTSAPMSKNWSFGVRDIEEMLFLLSDLDTCSNERSTIRPSRIRQMFASRACRKSIMIGQSLKEAEMYSILGNLSKLEHPWNCPHGRPTMRHLMDLNLMNVKFDFH